MFCFVFLTRRFFKFSVQIYSENEPRPQAAMFFAWIVLVEGHQRKIPAKLDWNRSSGFWEDFEVVFIDIQNI